MVMTAEQLKNHFDTAIGQLHATLTNQRDEITSFGQTKTETAAKLTELEATLAQLGNDIKEVARSNASPNGQSDRAKLASLGEQFVTSDEYKNMVTHKMRTSTPFHVGSILPKNRFALTTDTPASGANVAAFPQTLPGFISPMQPTLRMRNLIPVHPTSQGSVEYVRTTGFFPVYTEMTAATAAAATAVVVESTAGLSVGQPILVGLETRTVASVVDDTNITVAPALTNTHPIGERVASRVVGATAQGQTKPTGEFNDFTLENEPIKTIAASVDVARQALDDVAQLRSFMDNQLVFEMGYSEEWNILYGNGGSGQLQGILTDSDRQTYKWSDGKVQDIGGTMIADTKIDALRRAITMVQMARYPADGVVLHPREWEDFELMKGSDGHYIWLQLPNSSNTTSFFRYPVVVTDAIAEGTALTGAFALGTALWDREQANVRASDQHADNFKKNLVSLLAEERVAQTIFRPEAFVEITFDAAPT